MMQMNEKNIAIIKKHGDGKDNLLQAYGYYRWILHISLHLKNFRLTQDAETANNTYIMTLKRQLIRYLHQCLFYPPKNTLPKHIANNQFTVHHMARPHIECREKVPPRLSNSN